MSTASHGKNAYPIVNNLTGAVLAAVDDAEAIDVLASVKLGGVALTANAAELNALHGSTATATELSEYSLTVYMADAGTSGSVFVVIPHAGEIRGLSAVNVAANVGTKTVLGAKIGSTAVTHPAWEVAVTAAAGTKSSVVPTAENTVAADSVLEITSDGGSSAVTPVVFTVKILR